MKGQIQGQVFVYVLSLLIIAGVLVFGYSAIQDFRTKSEQVTLVKLQTDLQNEVDGISSDFGSVKQLRLTLGDFNEICFTENYDTPNLADFSSANPLILDSVRSGTEQNVFLLTDTLEHSFLVPSVSVSPDYLCIQKRGSSVLLRLEGRGDHTIISPWPIL